MDQSILFGEIGLFGEAARQILLNIRPAMQSIKVFFAWGLTHCGFVVSYSDINPC